MDGIIFDLDGTLWDPTEEVAIAWNEVLEQVGLDRRVTEAELKTLFGKPLVEIIDILLPRVEKEQLEKVVVLLYEKEHSRLEGRGDMVYDSVMDGIKTLSAKYPLYMVSNCQSGYIEVFFRATGLGVYFKDYTCPGDTGMFKADNIRLIMERNQLEQVVYVGDTAGDKAACDKAGVPMIHMTYGFGEVESPLRSLHSFDQLLEIDFDELLGSE